MSLKSPTRGVSIKYCIGWMDGWVTSLVRHLDKKQQQQQQQQLIINKKFKSQKKCIGKIKIHEDHVDKA